MRAKLTRLTRRPAWKALAAHYKHARTWHLRELFAQDPERGERLTAEAVGLYLDRRSRGVSPARRSANQPQNLR